MIHGFFKSRFGRSSRIDTSNILACILVRLPCTEHRVNYEQNNNGPSFEPWGIPVVTGEKFKS